MTDFQDPIRSRAQIHLSGIVVSRRNRPASAIFIGSPLRRKAKAQNAPSSHSVNRQCCNVRNPSMLPRRKSSCLNLFHLNFQFEKLGAKMTSFERISPTPRLPSLESMFWMLFMVAYDRDADAVGDFPK